MSWVRRNLLFEVRLFMFSVATHTLLGLGHACFITIFLKQKPKKPHLLSLNCPKCRTQQFQKSYLILIIQRWKTFISPPKNKAIITKVYFIRYKCIHNLVIFIKTTLYSLSVTIPFTSLFPLLYDQHFFQKSLQLMAVVLCLLCIFLINKTKRVPGTAPQTTVHLRPSLGNVSSVRKQPLLPLGTIS